MVAQWKAQEKEKTVKSVWMGPMSQCLRSIPHCKERPHVHCKKIKAHKNLKQVISLFLVFLFLFFKVFNVYFWERERERASMNQGGAERKGDRGFEAGSVLTAWRGTWTHKPWDHDLSWNQMLKPTELPRHPYFYTFKTKWEVAQKMPYYNHKTLKKLKRILSL